MARAFLDLHRAYRQTHERLASLDEALGRDGSGIGDPGGSRGDDDGATGRLGAQAGAAQQLVQSHGDVMLALEARRLLAGDQSRIEQHLAPRLERILAQGRLHRLSGNVEVGARRLSEDRRGIGRHCGARQRQRLDPEMHPRVSPNLGLAG